VTQFKNDRGCSFLKTCRALEGIEAGRRIATVVIVAFVVLLITAGCLPEKPPVQKPPVVVTAGDIAVCAREGDEATAKLVEGIDGATVLTLGDNAYPEGSAEDFEECYEPTWGEFKNRTKPVPGNHEYYTEGARGYFEYFGEAAGDPEEGYYSYELGSWHIVALNSNCGEAQIRCSPSSTQVRWLEEDLAANADNEGGAPWPTCTTRASAREKNTAATRRWSLCGKLFTRRGRR
jgi:hypothetical protein